ncbi:MBL fold metallo-hydrolase [Streptococcus sp. S784/96/1]|uniref:MBL fold metallo-hydrolase n=1 Tax=Streptococcus sp. S784/96/1 TaxID=2653499 RepID=UPI001389688D|nr:MBL fold metallo-hydrolase [Streptococcus sp. S784/96/1]
MNPLEVFASYTAYQLKERTWVIQFMGGSQHIYLLEGDEQALLLDTGYGSGTLRAFAQTLTTKPLICANTHFHPDHSSGNGEFEEVLVNSGYVDDEPSVMNNTGPFDITRLPFPHYRKKLIEAGDVIDLGNRQLKLLEVKPAHCNSSLFFFDEGERMMFCGDEMESAQVLLLENSRNPKMADSYDIKERLLNFKANTELLLSYQDQYDYLLPNHNGGPIAKSYLQDYLDLVDGIFAGTVTIEDRLNHRFIEMDPRSATFCRIRYGKGSIILVKDDVLKVFGTGLENGDE